MPDRFDAIVVGAGPAGAAAALTLARQHRSVLVIERGPAPGACGASAGLLRGSELTRLFPDGVDLVTERTIVDERVLLFDAHGSVSFDFRDHTRGGGSPTVRSALARRLAGPLADRAVAAGATMRVGLPIELPTSARSGGLRVGGAEVSAPIVLHTDPRAAPPPPSPTGGPGVEQRVEATYRLSPRSIERRLGVGSGEGASLECLLPSEGPRGHAAGFLVPGTDTLAVGVTVGPADAAIAGRVFESFTTHPSIAPLLAGAELIDRQAYPRTFRRPDANGVGGDGYLLAGDCLGLDDPSGAFAPGLGGSILSGRVAAEVAVSGGGPTAYARALRRAGVAAAMQLGRELHLTLQTNPRLHGAYPGAMGQALHELMSESGARKRSVMGILRTVRRSSRLGWSSMAGDALTLGRVL